MTQSQPEPSSSPAGGAASLLTAFLAGRRIAEDPELKRALARAKNAPAQRAAYELALERGKRRVATASETTAPARPAAKAQVRAPIKARKVRRPASRPTPARTRPVSEVIAVQLTRSDRQAAVALLRTTGLSVELEHLHAIEERLTVNTVPAQHHAALSTRILLRGLADRFFPAAEQPFEDRFGRRHATDDENVGNRLAAFVDIRLRSSTSQEEHCQFIANLDLIKRWCGRGPHRIYDPLESQRFFLRLLELLSYVFRAYETSPVPVQIASQGMVESA